MAAICSRAAHGVGVAVRRVNRTTKTRGHRRDGSGEIHNGLRAVIRDLGWTVGHRRKGRERAGCFETQLGAWLGETKSQVIDAGIGVGFQG